MDGRNNDTPLSILPPLLRFIAFPSNALYS